MSSIDDDRTHTAPPCPVVYEVSDSWTQQVILDDLRTAAMDGVVALGTNGPQGARITVRCETLGEEVLVDHVVRELDPDAALLARTTQSRHHPSTHHVP